MEMCPQSVQGGCADLKVLGQSVAPVVEEGVRRTGWAEGEQWVIQSPGGQGRGRGACQGQRGESGAHALYPHDTLGPRVSHPPWASGSPLQVATGNKNTETPLTV